MSTEAKVDVAKEAGLAEAEKRPASAGRRAEGDKPADASVADATAKTEETKNEKAEEKPYNDVLAENLAKIKLNAKQLGMVKAAGGENSEFKGYKVCVLNCTLKKSPEISHTDGILAIAEGIYKALGCEVDHIRLVDHEVATGVYPDMTARDPKGWPKDEWPAIYKRVMDADILLLTSPVWLGMKSSVCNKAIERLYANSHLLNDKGQYSAYGKVGTCLVTGNEDGAKHCAIEIIYALQHLGFLIPPQADAGYLGMNIGPGPSLLDDPDKFLANDFAARNTTFMCFNALVAAQMIKKNGGWPKVGNSRTDWDVFGANAENPNPEHRS
jgi:multimeric flavodoxin WrbA